MNIIQNSQNKIVREIFNAPWYARKTDVNRDFAIPTVIEEIKQLT